MNTISKLTRQPINVLQGLSYSTIMNSSRVANGSIDLSITTNDPGSIHTPFDKLSRRTVEEIDGLYINVIEKSDRRIDSDLSYDVWSKNEVHNTINKLRRSPIDVLQGLFIRVLEQSERRININGRYRITKPNRVIKGIKLKLVTKEIIKLK